MNKSCLECGDKIIGREDKKFCGDSCRNAFNNKLRKNYRILCAINSEGKTKIARNKMANKGFDFDYCTSIFKTKTGNTYYFMYDYGYMELKNNYCILVKKKLI